MAALTKGKTRKYEVNPASFIQPFEVAASTEIFAGSLVCVNASGYLVNAIDTASFRFIGIANQDIDNSSGGNSDLSCDVRINTREWMTKTTPTVADLGKAVSIVDTDTVQVSLGTNVKALGIVVKYSTTEVLVQFDISIQEVLA